MGFIELDLSRIVIAILFVGAELGQKCYQRQTSFVCLRVHGACLHLRLDV
jgi:hypothetical protein